MSQITEFDQLMAEVAAGSEDAILQLAESYTPYIIRSVRRCFSQRMRQKLDSQDVAQTLWASLLLRRSDLLRLKSQNELIAFLVKATRNKVAEKATKLRRQKRDIEREVRLESELVAPTSKRSPSSQTALHSKEPTPSTTASLRERWRDVMSNASERDRQIVDLLFKRHTYLEIGSILSIHEQTARRAVEKLVEELSR